MLDSPSACHVCSVCRHMAVSMVFMLSMPVYSICLLQAESVSSCLRLSLMVGYVDPLWTIFCLLMAVNLLVHSQQ